MIREDKDLLLKDLCARLPYGVIINTPKGDGHLCSINQTIFRNEYGVNIEATKRDYFNDDKLNFKPYLRPMSSITTEEEYEYHQIRKRNSYKSLTLMDCSDHLEQLLFPIIVGTESIDWLNAHHFDYRGLIEKGLALKAPEGMYNIN